MIFHFHKTKVSVNLFIVLKISLASHVTLLVIVIITCIHERKSPFASCRNSTSSLRHQIKRKAQSKDWAFRFICCLSVNALLSRTNPPL